MAFPRHQLPTSNVARAWVELRLRADASVVSACRHSHMQAMGQRLWPCGGHVAGLVAPMPRLPPPCACEHSHTALLLRTAAQVCALVLPVALRVDAMPRLVELKAALKLAR